MRKRARKWLPYLLLTPALLYYIVFWLRPVLTALVESFTDIEGTLSLTNYITVFSEPVFKTAFLNSAGFAIASVILQFILALMLALLLNKKFKGVNLLLFVALIPMAVPQMAVAVLWKTGFASFGWVNNLLFNLNIISKPLKFLTVDGIEALGFLVIIDTWTVLPSVMIILLAGLQNMNKEYEEAACIFGASRWQVIKDITIPILKPTIVTAIILRMIAAIQVWAIAVMIFGYGRVPFLVERIAYYTDVVSEIDTSYKNALAYSVIVTVIVLTAAMLYLRINSRKENE
jgi:multiple sugar transport system permease protein